MQGQISSSTRRLHCALPAGRIYSTDVEGRIVLQQALEYGVKRFIHISTTAVYGVPDHHPIFELTPSAALALTAWQDQSRKPARISPEGLCVPILRPKSFVGPERLGVFAIFIRMMGGRNFPMIEIRVTTATNCWTSRIFARLF